MPARVEPRRAGCRRRWLYSGKAKTRAKPPNKKGRAFYALPFHFTAMRVISRLGVSPRGEPAAAAEQVWPPDVVEEQDAFLDEPRAGPDALQDALAEQALPPVEPAVEQDAPQDVPAALPDGSALVALQAVERVRDGFQVESAVPLGGSPDGPVALQADLRACLAALPDAPVAPQDDSLQALAGSAARPVLDDPVLRLAGLRLPGD